jgi:CheY-like chemotaxis protein
MLDILLCPLGPHRKSDSGVPGFPVRETAAKPSKRSMLVMVDDDEDDCFLVQAALKEACMNCSFRCVPDGLEMMDYLNRRGRYRDSRSAPVPDLILLDLNLPRMDGRQLLEYLKKEPRFRGIPVIILTTSRDREDIRNCYDLGANSYIAKQASFEELVSIMKTITEYWFEVAALPPPGIPVRCSSGEGKN